MLQQKLSTASTIKNPNKFNLKKYVATLTTASKTPFLLWPASDCFILSNSGSISRCVPGNFGQFCVSGMSLGTQSSSGLSRADPSQDPAQTPCALCCCDLVGDGGQAETMGCVDRNAVPPLAYTK